jgi:hypothetical protein
VDHDPELLKPTSTSKPEEGRGPKPWPDIVKRILSHMYELNELLLLAAGAPQVCPPLVPTLHSCGPWFVIRAGNQWIPHATKLILGCQRIFI